MHRMESSDIVLRSISFILRIIYLKFNVMSKWNDVYFRDNLSDIGNYPTSGVLSHSPDIIPYGIMPVENPNQFFIIDNWKKDVGKDLLTSYENYIYLRASNLAGKDQKGRFYLYWAKASLLLYPNFWKDQVIKTQNGQDYYEFSVTKEGKVVSGDNIQGTFIWKPEMITCDHYCLIGRIVTDDHPNPIPEVGDVESFAHFIANNINYAWRNVTVVERDVPTKSVDVDYEEGDLEADIHFLLRCTNVPVGAEVMLTCSTPGTIPALNIQRQKVTNPESQVFGIVCHVPRNWEGKLTYHYFANGVKPTKGFDIQVEPVLVNDVGHHLYKFGKSLEALGIPQEIRGIGPKTGIRLGGHKIKAY